MTRNDITRNIKMTHWKSWIHLLYVVQKTKAYITFLISEDRNDIPCISYLEHPILTSHDAFNQNHSLQWRHNGCNGISNHQPHDCLLNRLFRRRSKKTWKLRVTGICEGNSPVTGEFPAQKANNAEMFPFDDVIMEDRNDMSYISHQ